MTIRRLSPGDEATAESASRLFGATGTVDPSGFLARDDVHLFVSEDDTGVAGWVYGQELLHPDGEITMLLYALDVAERSRREGRGTALVRALVEQARVRGCTEVWVLTDDDNAAGLATYAAAGGVREPDDQVMFVWPLSARTDGGT